MFHSATPRHLCERNYIRYFRSIPEANIQTYGTLYNEKTENQISTKVEVGSVTTTNVRPQGVPHPRQNQ